MRWRAAAVDDLLLDGLPDPFLTGALHDDGIDVLPPAATWLAESAMYPHQAFRVADRSWGVQFHPEVSVASMRMWMQTRQFDDSSDPRHFAGVLELAAYRIRR